MPSAWSGAPTTEQLRKRVDPILNDVFANKIDPEMARQHDALCMTDDPGDKTENVYPFFGDVDYPVEFGGMVPYSTLRSAVHYVDDQTWVNGIFFDKNDIEDSTGLLIKKKIEQLSISQAEFKELRLAKYIAGGDGTDVGTTALGGAMFANSHTWGDMVCDNLLGQTGVTLSDLRTDFALATDGLLGFLNDKAKPMNKSLNNSNLAVMCSPALRTTFLRLFNEQFTLYGQSNIFQGAADLMVNPYLNTSITSELTSANTWYLFRTDEGRKPFIFVPRKGIETSVEYEAKTRRFYYSAEQRFAHGYWVWTSGVQVGS